MQLVCTGGLTERLGILWDIQVVSPVLYSLVINKQITTNLFLFV